MIPKDFPQANLTMAAPEEAGDAMQNLRVFCDGSSYTSLWVPTADELAALNAGKGVLLTLFQLHPPVFLSVEGVSSALADRSKKH